MVGFEKSPWWAMIRERVGYEIARFLKKVESTPGSYFPGCFFCFLVGFDRCECSLWEGSALFGGAVYLECSQFFVGIRGTWTVSDASHLQRFVDRVGVAIRIELTVYPRIPSYPFSQKNEFGMCG